MASRFPLRETYARTFSPQIGLEFLAIGPSNEPELAVHVELGVPVGSE